MLLKRVTQIILDNLLTIQTCLYLVDKQCFNTNKGIETSFTWFCLELLTKIQVLEKQSFVNEKSFFYLWASHKLHPMKSEFNLSSKRRICDSVCIYGTYYRVSTLIENNPMLLWNAIHPKKYERESGSAENKDVYMPVSLVRPAYDMLKKAVAKIAPSEVAIVEAQFEQRKMSRQHAKQVNMLKHEIASGIIGTQHARFKRL